MGLTQVMSQEFNPIFILGKHMGQTTEASLHAR